MSFTKLITPISLRNLPITSRSTCALGFSLIVK
jgi:hypothetical protein